MIVRARLRRGVLAGAWLGLIACDKGGTSPPPPSSSAIPIAPATATLADASPPAPPEPRAASASDAAAPRPVLATEGCGALMPAIPVRSAKSIGHTSVVFKIELATNQKMAWKPSSKRGKERWRGEVAAAKLGDALAISNVPPACMRTFTLAELGPLLPKGALDEVIANDDGTIHGAMIPWIEGLQFMALEKEPLRTQTRTWLGPTDAGVPADKTLLAAQLSTLVVFDAITGNWDRYSGGNVGLDASGQHVLFIDNDAAFMDGAPTKDLAANAARLESTERFSRALVKRLRTLDVASAFGTLPDRSPLLPEAMQKTVRERIASVLRVVDAKIAARSEDAVLYFP